MRRWFGSACTASGLGWSPTMFWAATVPEYLAACEGHNRLNAGGVEPMSRERMDALVAEHGQTSRSIKRRK